MFSILESKSKFLFKRFKRATLLFNEFKISDYNVTLGVSDIKNLNANFVKSTLVNDEVKFGTKSEVKVYNLNGQLIKTAQVSETKSLDASDLQSGMYIITGTLDRKPVSQKIIKK